jgi:hypothetical protein
MPPNDRMNFFAATAGHGGDRQRDGGRRDDDRRQRYTVKALPHDELGEFEEIWPARTTSGR